MMLDNLPPETKDLQEAVDSLINNKENSNQIDIKKMKRKHEKNLEKIKYGILPHSEEDPEHRLITKTRFEQLIGKQDDKMGSNKLKDPFN